MLIGFAAVGLLAMVAMAPGAAAELEWVYPDGGEYLSGTETIEWEDTDGDDDGLYELTLHASGTQLEQELCEECPGMTYEFDTTEYADGTEYVLEVDDDQGVERISEDEELATTDGTFTIDNTVPETTIAEIDGHTGLDGWYTGDVHVELEARDETSGVDDTLFAVDGGSSSSYDQSIRLADDGVRELSFHSVDRAGNAEDARTITLPIDATDPTSSISVGEPKADDGRVTYVNEDTEISLSAADATSGVDRIEFRVDDANWQVYDGPFTLDGEDGEYTVEFRAVDEAGNVGDVNVLRLELDQTVPELTRDRPEMGGVYVDDTLIAETHPLNVEAGDAGISQHGTVADTTDFATATGNLTVQADSSDAGAGVDEVRFYVDGELRATDSSAPFEWTWDTGKEVLGEHELVIESEDRVTNVASTDALDVQVVPDDPDGLERTVNEGPSIPDRVPSEDDAPEQPEPPAEPPEDLPDEPPEPPATTSGIFSLLPVDVGVQPVD